MTGPPIQANNAQPMQPRVLKVIELSLFEGCGKDPRNQAETNSQTHPSGQGCIVSNDCGQEECDEASRNQSKKKNDDLCHFVFPKRKPKERRDNTISTFHQLVITPEAG